MNKRKMHKPESIHENEKENFPSDFEIETDFLISTRQPDLVIVNN